MKKSSKTKYFKLKGLQFPFEFQRLFHLTLIVWIIMISILIISVLLFGYEMTDADLPCGALAGVLIAYFYYICADDV